jgi:small-conductance mechanosensitive channel
MLAMNTLWEAVPNLLASEGFQAALRAILVLVIGVGITKVIQRRLQIPQLRPQQLMIFRRVATFVVMGIAISWALRELGLGLEILLGAAGVLTVALGFASQTSASNLISGLFLMTEQPFVVGDIITVGDITGEVLSVDLLSVRLRKFDNLLVRIPNETMLKSNVVNLTHFAIRRFDLMLGVAYKEDITRVRDVLYEIAHRNPLCLEEPAPLFLTQGFGESSVDLQFSVWGARENYLELRNTITAEVKRAFDEAGIEIPFPHRTLYTGSVTTPLPVQLVATTNEPVPASV